MFIILFDRVSGFMTNRQVGIDRITCRFIYCIKSLVIFDCHYNTKVMSINEDIIDKIHASIGMIKVSYFSFGFVMGYECDILTVAISIIYEF